MILVRTSLKSSTGHLSFQGLWSSHWVPSGLSSSFIILQTQILFKLPYIVAAIALPLSASASASQLEVSLPLPNVVVFSDKNDAFFTRIVSTPLSLISSCSFLLLRCISRFLLTVSWCQHLQVVFSTQCRLSLVRKHPSRICEWPFQVPQDCYYEGQAIEYCLCLEGVSRISIFRKIPHWHRNYSWIGVCYRVGLNATNQTRYFKDLTISLYN